LPARYSEVNSLKRSGREVGNQAVPPRLTARKISGARRLDDSDGQILNGHSWRAGRQSVLSGFGQERPLPPRGHLAPKRGGSWHARNRWESWRAVIPRAASSN